MDTRGSHTIHGVFRGKGNAAFEKGVETPYFECAEYAISGAASHAGATTQAYVWENRWLTEETENDTPDFAVLDDGPPSRITLPKGAYHIEASAPAFGVDSHQTRLWDVTGAAMIIEGTSEFADATQSRSYIQGQFALSQETTIELQHSFSTVQGTGNGFGADAGFYIDNVYSTMQIWQLREDS